MGELAKTGAGGDQAANLNNKNTHEQKAATKKPKGWLGRSLANYHAQHEALAAEKGVKSQFMAAKTLTAARKVLFGK